ncbi:MAG: hypothetical protein IPM57_09860 [Oligoflexia bacterium]|nr:hypothetical protein [Oligoflexia bacterium]
METKLLVTLLLLSGELLHANVQKNIEHFSKTFTSQNVEISQKPGTSHFEASAKLSSSGKKQIILEGNFEKIEPDVLDLVMCHELGHAEGEFPRKPPRFDDTEIIGDDGFGLYSSEGAADYYATYRCLKYLWKDQENKVVNANNLVQEKCENKFKDIKAAQLCIRSAQAAFNYLDVKPWPEVSFKTPDKSIVQESIIDSYPSRQCRLDTFIAGALNEKRPACWYKEKTPPLETICYSYGYQIDPPPEPSGVPKCRVVGETMYIDGLIDSNILSELTYYHPHVKKLELNSFGGEVQTYQDSVADLYKMADLIRSKGITTNVRKGARCASACTILYMAGAKRTAHPDAIFLFHGLNGGRNDFDTNFWEVCKETGTKDCNKELEEIEKIFISGTEELFKKYVELGASSLIWQEYQTHKVDPNWLKRGNFFKKFDWVMTALEAQQLNVVQSFSFY